MLTDRHPHLHIRDEDTQKLRDEFHDEKIYFVFNVQTKKLEAWYEPNSGPPYIISPCENVGHAIRKMREQLRFEKMKAIDILKEVDEYNANVTNYRQNEAMVEVRSELRKIAAGKQSFTMSNPFARKYHAAL